MIDNKWFNRTRGQGTSKIHIARNLWLQNLEVKEKLRGQGEENHGEWFLFDDTGNKMADQGSRLIQSQVL
jgi:hypothetical protein